MPGVRYRINEPAPGYRFGPWKGYATTDNLQPWGGTQEWIDGQGTYFAIAIWVNGYWDGTLMDLEFTGQTAQFDEEFEVWQVEHAERMKKMREDEAAEEKEMEEGSRAERERTGEDYNTWRLRELRRTCRGGCGEKKPTFMCSKCRCVRECFQIRICELTFSPHPLLGT